MSMGWICLHRSLQDHWLFNIDEPDKFFAWIDLLMMANHKPETFMIKNKLVECKRGQVAKSQITLQKRWKWSQNKLKRFLNLLKNDGMIVYETNEISTIITILNYEKYQNIESAESSKKSSKFKKVSFFDKKMDDQADEQKPSISDCIKKQNGHDLNIGERPDGRPDGRPGGRSADDQADDKQQYNNENNETNNITFDDFYSAYPRKTARASAEKAWKKISPSLYVTICHDVAIRKEKVWHDKNFIPHPATYLNGKRWEDEIDDKIKFHKSAIKEQPKKYKEA